MPPVEVVVLEPMPDDALAHIAQVDPRVRVVDARGWFDAELRATWPAWTVQRYVEQRPSPPSTRAERDRQQYPYLCWIRPIFFLCSRSSSGA